MFVPNISPLACLEVARLIGYGLLGNANQVRLNRLGFVGYLNQVGLVSICAKFHFSSLSRSGQAN